MKKLTFTLMIALAGLFTSCSNEQTAISTLENSKTQEMKNFDSALKSLMKPENRSTPEEKSRLGAQLNERSLDILYKASNNLLTVNRIEFAKAESREGKEKVISQATKLYFEKLRGMEQNAKSEN